MKEKEFVKSKQQVELENVIGNINMVIGTDITAEKLKNFPVLKEEFDVKLYEFILRTIKYKYKNKAKTLYIKNNGCIVSSDPDSVDCVLSAASEIYTLLYTRVKKGPNKGLQKLDVLFKTDRNYFCFVLSMYIKNFFLDKLKGRISYDELDKFIQIFLDADLYGNKHDKRIVVDEFFELLNLKDEADTFLLYYDYIKKNGDNQSVNTRIKSFFIKKYNFVKQPIIQPIFKTDKQGEEFEDPNLVDSVFLEDIIEVNEELEDVFDKIAVLPENEMYALLVSSLGYSFEEIAEKNIRSDCLCNIISNYSKADNLVKKLQVFLENNVEKRPKEYYVNCASRARKTLRNTYKNAR